MKIKYLILSIASLFTSIGFTQNLQKAMPFGVEIGAIGSCNQMKNRVKALDPSTNFNVQIDTPDISAGDFTPAGKLYPDARSIALICQSGKIINMTIIVTHDEFGKNVVEAIKVLDSKYEFASGSDLKELMKGGNRFYESVQSSIRLKTNSPSEKGVRLFTITYEDRTEINKDLLERKREDLKNTASRFNAL